MIDLALGTRFYYKGKLCKVVETEYEYRCSECALSIDECSVMNCASVARKDGKNVCFKWVEDTKETEDIKDTEDTEETMNKATVNTEDCDREKTLVEEISELKIDESLKERILNKIESLEKKNDEYTETINKYYSSTRRLERTIVKLAAALADTSDSVIEDQVIHLIDIGTQTASSKRC